MDSKVWPYGQQGLNEEHQKSQKACPAPMQCPNANVA